MGNGRYVRCKQCQKYRQEVGASKLCRACYDEIHEIEQGFRVGSWEDPEVQTHHQNLCHEYEMAE